MYLCCDLGGTVADWAVYNTETKEFIFRINMKVSDFGDFYDMLDKVLEEYGKQGEEFGQISNTTLGVAGPTDHNSVKVTNIVGWEVNNQTVNDFLEEHGHEGYSSIINDFEALGYGVLYLLENGFDREKMVPIYGRFNPRPARTGEHPRTRSLICGPGTGLGIASIVDDLNKDGFPYIISSEGGHHTLSPESAEQFRLLNRSDSFQGMISYEEVLSHAGLKNLYNYFRREDYSAEPNYSISSDQIITLATSGKDQAATDAIEMFCEILANFCGNSALTFNTDKAIFLWGGVLLDLPKDLLQSRFKRDYTDRCNLSSQVSRVPVVLMTDKNLPLYGCVHRSDYEVKHLKGKE